MAWGNTDGSTRDQDLISGAANKNILKINDVNDNDDDKKALEVINTSTDADARALKATGISELDGKTVVNDIDENDVALSTTNTNEGANARALKATGKVEIVNGDLLMNQSAIETSGAANLEIGTGLTNEVHIGQVNKVTRVSGSMRVNQQFSVGPGNGDGAIDAFSSGDAQDLKIGSNDDTADVVIGNTEADTKTEIVNDLQADSQVIVQDLDDNDIALSTTNTNAGANARALKATGKSEFDGKVVVDDLDAEDIAVQITNSRAGDNAKALMVEGLCELSRGNFGPAIYIEEDNGTGSIYLGTVAGRPRDNPRMMLEAGLPPGVGPGARLEAHIDELGNHQAEGTLYLNNDPGTFDVLISHGDTQEAQNNPATVRVISPRMTLGNIDGQVHEVGQLDGNGSEDELNPDPLDLKIGTRFLTGDVHVGNTDHEVIVNTEVKIGNAAGQNALIDATLDGAATRDLDIGTGNSTADVNISRNGQDVNVEDDLNVGGDLTVDGQIIVGPVAGVANINAGGNPNPQDINIGAGNSTADVNLGQAGQDVNVIDDIKVGGDANIGPTGSAGKIDSGGSAISPQDLKIGSSSETNDLELSRSGQSIKAKGQLVMNSNNLIMDNSSALSSGSGFVYNATGSGSAGESIDVYIGGVKVGYFDANGFH